MARSQQPPPGQLDLFQDSGAVIAVNEAIAALARRDAGQAGTRLESLAGAEPGHRLLAPLRRLCQTLRDWPPKLADSAEIAAAARWLDIEIVPLADSVLGKQAAEFMRPFWRDLADAAKGQPYRAEFPQGCSAGLYLRCGANREAVAAAEAIPDQEANPDALRWLAVSRYRLGDKEGYRSALLGLALQAPEHWPQVLDEIGDAGLRADWENFQAACGWLDPDDPRAAAWFPAWYLLEHPGVRAMADAAWLPDTPAAEAFALMERLCALEKQGHSAELVAARGRLRELRAELFDAYMVRNRRRRK